jgi:hypothetical protein
VKKYIILISLLILEILNTNGFALLAHEAIIDATWEKSIVPLLKQKFPGVTEEQLKEAHAYVYGGSLMPDIGYYPLGSSLFTYLVHYVRTGDFISELLHEAKNVNEYAFAIGMFCHYNADKYGHSEGTNLAVPVLFPDIKEKFGDTVNFEQAPTVHIRTEFGFDVLQTAKGNYDSGHQHDLIGFKVSEPVLERACLKTYGLNLHDLFNSVSVAVESFRFIVKQMFPELAKDAWKVRKSIITKMNPLAEQAKYTQKMDKKSYNKEFGKPHIKSTFVTFMIAILPKIGPLAALKFKEPNEEAEKLFDKSFTAIVNHYSASLKKLETQHTIVENINFDTGKATELGEYKIADESYYKLLKKHKEHKFEKMNNGLKEHLISFYGTSQLARAYNADCHKINKILKMLEELKKTSVLPDEEYSLDK